MQQSNDSWRRHRVIYKANKITGKSGALVKTEEQNTRANLGHPNRCLINQNVYLTKYPDFILKTCQKPRMALVSQIDGYLKMLFEEQKERFQESSTAKIFAELSSYKRLPMVKLAKTKTSERHSKSGTRKSVKTLKKYEYGERAARNSMDEYATGNHHYRRF